MLGFGRFVKTEEGYTIFVHQDKQMRGTGKYVRVEIDGKKVRLEVDEMRDMTDAQYEGCALRILRSGWMKNGGIKDEASLS